MRMSLGCLFLCSRFLESAGCGLEFRIGFRADCRDGGDAHNDDECQHHGIFYRGRAIFVDQETSRGFKQLLHFK